MSYEMTPVEKALSYRNSGYNPEGLYQHRDKSGYIILEHPDDGKVEVDLPTDEDVKSVASDLGLDIQKSGM